MGKYFKRCSCLQIVLFFFYVYRRTNTLANPASNGLGIEENKRFYMRSSFFSIIKQVLQLLVGVQLVNIQEKVDF